MDLLKLSEGFKSGKIDLVEFYDDLIKKINDKKDLNCFISFDEKIIRDRVLELKDKLNSKKELGSLFGVPVSLKDNILFNELPSTCGSKMLENYKPIFNATVTKRLLDNDAVIVGKANMDEFAMGGSGETSFFGNTKNPLDENLIPGGSSSGSASSVSADLCTVSLGSDTGGSVRNPASFCSIVGYKPTYGLISRYGVVSMSNSLDQVGILSKSCKDIFPVINVIGGNDEMDPTSMREEISFKYDENFNISNIKVCALKKLDEYGAQKEIIDDYYLGIKKLEELGVKVDYIDFKYAKYSTNVYSVIMSCEVSSNMSRFDGVRYGYQTENYDSTKDMFVNTRSEGFGEEVKRRIALGTFFLASSNNQELYKKGLKVRKLISNEFTDLLKSYDFIITPTCTILPPKFGKSKEDALSSYAGDTFNCPVNFAGLCAVSVPLRNGKIGGSLQFVANRFEDEKLLNFCAKFEGGKK